MATTEQIVQQLERTLRAAGLDPRQARRVVEGKDPQGCEDRAGLSLVLLDMDRIQETVLASPRPVTIFGVSGALRTWDEELGQEGGRSTALKAALQDATIIYAGGGNALLIVPSKDLPERLDRLERELRDRLPGATMTPAVLAVTPRALAGGPAGLSTSASSRDLLRLGVQRTGEGFGALVSNLQLELRHRKGEPADHPFLPRPSSAVRCEECARRPRSSGRLCAPCAHYRERGGQGRRGSQARSFEELFEESPRIAYVYLDGRGIGRKLRGERTLAGYAALSERLHRVFVEGPRRQVEAEYAGSAEDDPAPRFQIVLSGGDDFLFVVPATGPRTDVFSFTARLLQSIRDSGGLAAGAGVVVTKTMAADYACSRARELCRHAKDMIEGADTTAIDFEFLLSGSPEVLTRTTEASAAEAEAGPDRMRQTQRPYDLASFKVLVEKAGELARKLPAAQLMNLRSAFAGDGSSAQVAFLYQLARTPELRRVLLPGPLSRTTIPPLVLRPGRDGHPETALPDLIDVARTVLS